MPNTPNRKARWAVALLIGYWCALTTATHIPIHGGGSALTAGLPIDEMAHFILYAGLAVTAMAAVVSFTAPTTPIAMGVMAIIISWAAVDEATQEWIPTRSPEFADWVLDSVGALFGLGLFGVGRAVLRLWICRRGERPRLWFDKAPPEAISSSSAAPSEKPDE